MKNILILLSIAQMLSSCNPKNTRENISYPIDENATEATVDFYNRLFGLMDNGIMLGHQDALAYGVNWYNEPNRSDIHDVTGQYPAIVGWEIGHIEIAAPYNLDSIYFDNMKRYIREAHNRGSVNTISWHGDNIVTGNTAWDCAQDYVVKSILPGGENHEEYLIWLDRVADFFLDLKDNAGNLIPVMFRMYHEHTGAWFWWGSKQCTPEEYKQLWILTVEHLRDKRNVHNIIYAYSPSETKDEAEYLERYPGDEYVDVVGFDCYASGENAVYDPEKLKAQVDRYCQALRHNLDIVTTYAAKTGKIPCIAETGMEKFPPADFFSNSIYNTIRDYKISYVLFWRNANNRPGHYYVPYKGSNNENDFRTFVAQPDILMAEDIINTQ